MIQLNQYYFTGFKRLYLLFRTGSIIHAAGKDCSEKDIDFSFHRGGTMSNEKNHRMEDDLRERLVRAILDHLHAHWPKPLTIFPSMFYKELSVPDRMFIDVIQSFIDDGLISVEFFIIGTAEPMARETVLTRKGASLRLAES